MRKDGSKALGGERLSEAQKGAVQLRHEPPDVVPVVKEIITRPREGRVPSAILGGNTTFRAVQPISRANPSGSSVCPLGLHDFCRRGRKVMPAFCKRAQAGALPVAGPSFRGLVV